MEHIASDQKLITKTVLQNDMLLSKNQLNYVHTVN